MGWKLALPGYVLAALLGWLLLMAREDLGEAREECNTRVAIAAVESERLAREALSAAHRREIAELEARAQNEAEARRLAELAASESQADADSARADVRRLSREAQNATELPRKCLNQRVPADVLNALRVRD